MGESLFSPSVELDRRRIADAIAALIDQGLIATGPELARIKIGDAFECGPSTDGKDCRGILRVRELVASIDPHLACSLMIGAPHTHWERGDYILEQFDVDRDSYLIGPSQVLPNPVQPPFIPISFVFHRKGPQPYEWTDASTGLWEETDLKRLSDGLETLNNALLEEFGERPFPLGVTVNHRFKRLWDPPTTGTNERPAPQDPRFAIVERAAPEALPPDGSVQVAWSAFVEEEYTSDEKRILDELNDALSDLDPAEAEKVLIDLEQYARGLAQSET